MSWVVVLAGLAAATPRDLLVSLAPPAGSPRQLDAWTAAIARDQAAALRCIRPAAVLRTYRATPVLFLRMDEAATARAANCPGVESIVPNRTFRPLVAQSVPLIGADAAWSTYGYGGAGTAVAVLDTGVDWTQADLGGCFGAGCKVVYGYDFADGDDDPDDCHGHGSNVAAIAAGTDGVAPDADIVAYKVFGGSSCADATDADIAAALDDVVLQAAAYNIVAVNLSIGTDDYRTSASCDGTGTATETAVNTVYAADVALIGAAGNDGDSDEVSFPACLRRVLAVANTYDATAGSTSWCTNDACSTWCTDSAPGVDSLNCSSNGGNIVDLAAPGTTITAGGQSMGGTSQASPHVAGAVALLSGVVPGTRPNRMETWLVRSAVSVTDARGSTTYTYPRLDLDTILAGSVDDLSVASVDLVSTVAVLPGAVLELGATVQNRGPGPVDGTELWLASDDADLDVGEGGPTAVGEVPVGGSAAVAGLPLTVSADCREDHVATVTVTLRDADGSYLDEGDITLSLRCVVDEDDDGVDPRDGDCDDTDDTIFPGAPETCDGADQDCDGGIDGPASLDALTWYADADLDGYGDAATPTVDCAAPAGFVADATDCDDGDAARHPGATESCGAALDADCDGVPGAEDPDADPAPCAEPDPDTGEPEPPACGCSGTGTTPTLVALGAAVAAAVRRPGRRRS